MTPAEFAMNYEDFAVVEWHSNGPEELWECRRCGAVVRNPSLHDRWHGSAATATTPTNLGAEG